ncbi:leucine-rich repeat-containing protein 25 isoform X1 [Bos indicus]|uniref:Leucine-rich repeat-containing protein 25 isoform X1 n=1 Tax=Bos indicus TaxID=9915 RepID=A0ABM4SLE6_BOSIN|nr:PREDICTED: leucine-rich repeat-containing protein 25 isoform X1 [Bos indicus]XP_027404080.1 leucine-rich repeat-containing protein 25 isoform X1 [Bos indicus x Bos taurus]XP_027404081.1 leucine-rich repeat-containing protein 25 isoform X1 [Bos indicus x Bos taurus]XP_061277532.1 leucine-rich repeat-containing protein 25 isoform X1 [Bos javanicus]
MGGPLMWALLLPLLLHQAGSQTSSCSVLSGYMDWTKEYFDTCLNFSGKILTQLPQNQSLRARSVQLLDLSANGLQRLPWSFFRDLEQLQLLIVTNNSLDFVDRALAKRCGLELLADCSCALLDWHTDRQDNCSGPELPRCLDVPTGAWHNLSVFLDVSCPSGLTKIAIGALAASGSLLLVLAIAGPVLAWRFCRHRMDQNLSKTWASQDGSRSGSGRQPRYSSQGRRPKSPANTPPRSSTPDYENMFVGPPAARHQWDELRSPPSEGGDFYMTYDSLQHESQPVYCNLQSLSQVPLDDEEYVVPGR